MGTGKASASESLLTYRNTSLTAAATGPCGLVIRRVTSAGIRRVHDKYITSRRQVHDQLSQNPVPEKGAGNAPLRHDTAARGASRPTRSVAGHGTARASLLSGDGRRTRSPPPRRLDGITRADPTACPGRRHGQDQPAAQREQSGGEPAAGMHDMHQSDGAVRVPCNGTKRARIGKASGSADRCFGPDAVRYMSVTIATPCPTAAHHDTRRDKKETARRAAFPQPAGRFRRWWQVLGSNQRRLSRRFYSVPLLSTPYDR